MKIILSPDIFLKLSVVENTVGKREFSGYGFINVDNSPKDGPCFNVYDIVLLDVGSTGYTEFPSSEILKLLDRPDSKKMKLWYHRHPLGNGKPGPHNWSGTDNATCRLEPLGCTDPNSVKWALAMVLTPGGWVGRVDQYKNDKVKTTHVPVEVDIDLSIGKTARQLLKVQKESEKKEKEPVNYKLLDLDTDNTYEGCHSAIDEGFHLLEVAKYQIADEQFQEAADSLSWCEAIAFKYKKNAYVSQRANTLRKSTNRLKSKLRRMSAK